MPIPLRESSSVVLTSERNQLIYEIQFKYIGNLSIDEKSYDVLWTCITTEVKVWNNSALKRIKWMKCSRNKMIRNKCNIFLVDWGIDKNKNRKPQAIQCSFQFHAVHFMGFMSCDSCHVIHVIWFMSCDSCHVIHVMWFMSWYSFHGIHVLFLFDQRILRRRRPRVGCPTVSRRTHGPTTASAWGPRARERYQFTLEPATGQCLLPYVALSKHV